MQQMEKVNLFCILLWPGDILIVLLSYWKTEAADRWAYQILTIKRKKLPSGRANLENQLLLSCFLLLICHLTLLKKTHLSYGSIKSFHSHVLSVQLFPFSDISLMMNRPLHLCIETWNTAVVRRWVEVASLEEIAEAIDVPSPVGTALCMAAALKKEHEKGNYGFASITFGRYKDKLLQFCLVITPWDNLLVQFHQVQDLWTILFFCLLQILICSNTTIDLHLPEGRELVRILLAAGADPTAQDDPHCRTALHTAAMIDDVELVKVKG